MKARQWVVLLLAAGSVAFISRPGFSASVCGVAVDSQGRAARGVQTIVEDEKGRIVGQGKTDDKGNYFIDRLSPGTYSFSLAERSNAYRGGSSVFSITGESKRIDWRIAAAKPAMAMKSGNCADLPRELGPSSVIGRSAAGIGAHADKLGKDEGARRGPLGMAPNVIGNGRPPLSPSM